MCIIIEYYSKLNMKMKKYYKNILNKYLLYNINSFEIRICIYVFVSTF